MSKPKSVLIVDDEPYLRSFLKSLLESRYDVRVAGSGAEALELTEFGADLMIIDVLMPGMSGFELCQRVRARTETRELPIIMLTALDESEMRVKCAAAGANDLVCKPFHPDDLMARVDQWIS